MISGQTKSKCLLPFVIFIFILMCRSTLLYTNSNTKTLEKQDTLKEYVEVVNVEVIIRALSSGQPVGGLKKSDFTLFENEKKRGITSFLEIRRKVGVEDIDTKKIKAPETPGKKRLFFLYFRISEPEAQYHNALDYFFDRVYREGDYVLMMVKNQVFKITRKHQVNQTLAQVKDSIDKTAKRTKLEKDRLREKMEKLFRDFAKQFVRNEQGNLPQDQLLDHLKLQYKTAWNEYKFKYITLSNNKLKAIAASLKIVDFEKWGLVFYQPDTFPHFNVEMIYPQRIESFRPIAKLRRIFDSFSREMQQPGMSLAFSKDIKQAFIDANATFHLLLSNPLSMGKLESVYLRMDAVYSDWKRAFKNISEATGGAVIAGKKLADSLKQAAEKEDIYYRLTYSPKISDQTTRKIRVTANDNRLKLLYNRQVTLKKVNEIDIAGFSFSHPVLEFILNHYQQLFDGIRLYGDIEIKVTAVDEKGKMLTFQKAFEPDRAEINVSMKLNFPRGGNYSLIVEAFDNQTGKSAVFSKKINIPKTMKDALLNEPVLISTVHKKNRGMGRDDDHQLKAILKRAADYCEKLKKTTFFFTCREEVMDSYIIKGEPVKKDSYFYDYQILKEENEKMTESRKLISIGDNAAKRKKDDHLLIVTNFFSNYPFLMPVTMLSRENQKKYRYQLLAREKIKNRELFKLSVDLKDPTRKNLRSINHGVVWVDANDGSVIKIELNPHSLRGIETLQNTARRKGTRLKVTDIHWYEKKRNGIRFPTRTEINGSYLARQTRDNKNPTVVEQVQTVFSYKKYLFFNVNVNVVDARHE